MSWLSQLRCWFERARLSSRKKRRPERRSALTVESLERRELLSTLHLDLGTATSPAAETPTTIAPFRSKERGL